MTFGERFLGKKKRGWKYLKYLAIVMSGVLASAISGYTYKTALALEGLGLISEEGFGFPLIWRDVSTLARSDEFIWINGTGFPANFVKVAVYDPGNFLIDTAMWIGVVVGSVALYESARLSLRKWKDRKKPLAHA